MYKCEQKQIDRQYYPHFLAQITKPNFGLEKAKIAPVYSPPSFFKNRQNFNVYNSLQSSLINSKKMQQSQISSLFIYFFIIKHLIFF